jgi:hypothetical protein
MARIPSRHTGDSMSFKVPDLKQRQSDAAAAKSAMLAKFRAAVQSPLVATQREKRAAIHQARMIRAAEREAAKRAREAELAEQAARAAELAEQKAARDARYAARKAAKKARRRGY